MFCVLDQVNEEICALCSDQPDSLVMCSACPRSYCQRCLELVLSPEMLNAVNNDDDWHCMSCNSHVSTIPLPQSSWKILSHKEISKRTSTNNKLLNTDKSPRSLNSNTQHKSKSPLVSDSPDVTKTNDSSTVPNTSNSQRLAGKVLSKTESTPDNPEELSISDPNNNDTDFKRKKRSLKIEIASPRSYGTPRVFKTHDISKFTNNPSTNINRKSKLISKYEQKREEPSESATCPSSVTGNNVKTSINDDLFYFHQYINYYYNLCQECSIVNLATLPIVTDDACFLCKDGGDLVECDWRLNGKKYSRCRKVYHSECLSYEVKDDQKHWHCPRHFCDVCGSTDLHYACVFCPVSICQNCPKDMVEKVSSLKLISSYMNKIYLSLTVVALVWT